MSRYKLGKYSINPGSSFKEWIVKIAMGATYAPIIEEGIPAIAFKWNELENGYFESIIHANSQEISKLQSLLEIQKKHLLLKKNKYLNKLFSEELDLCYALEFNFKYEETTDETNYTFFGLHEHKAKENEDESSIVILSGAMVDFCRHHPIFNTTNLVCSVPPNPSSQFHLPDELAKRVSSELKVDLGISFLRKKMDIPKAKDAKIEEKIKPLENTLVIDKSVINKKILLLDDLYQSGSTMWTIAKALKKAGAIFVYGLVCVKSWRDRDNQ